MAALALAFFVTALLYASVGFGGGSTYTALLALAVSSCSTVRTQDASSSFPPGMGHAAPL